MEGRRALRGGCRGIAEKGLDDEKEDLRFERFRPSAMKRVRTERASARHVGCRFTSDLNTLRHPKGQCQRRLGMLTRARMPDVEKKRRRWAAWIGRRCAIGRIVSTPPAQTGSSIIERTARSRACRKSNWPRSPGSSKRARIARGKESCAGDASISIASSPRNSASISTNAMWGRCSGSSASPTSADALFVRGMCKHRHLGTSRRRQEGASTPSDPIKWIFPSNMAQANSLIFLDTNSHAKRLPTPFRSERTRGLTPARGCISILSWG